MTALSVADRIPFELWLRIFNNLTLTELLPIMSVCSVWRQVVFACDGYSSLISLESTSDAAINFFLLRLERSRFRLTEAIVAVEQACDAIPTRVLPALSDHLDHLVGLAMKCHGLYGEQIMELVRNPAPRLRDLVIMLYLDASCSKSAAPYLPEDTLQRNSADLRRVALRNVHLPPSAGLPAFACVGTLTIAADVGRVTELDSILPSFPVLATMVVSGPVIVGPAARLDHRAWRSLLYLDVWIEAGWATDLFLRAPLHDIPTIRVRCMTELPLEICLGHLDGELEMTCWYDDDNECPKKYLGPFVAFSFAHRRSGRTRILFQPFMQWFADQAVSHCLQAQNVPERITALSLPDQLCASVFSLLPALDNLTSLQLSCNQKLFMTHGIRSSFPNLATLTLRGNGYTKLLSSELREFVQTTLLPIQSQAAPQIRLVLEQIEMYVEQSDDLSLFREVLIS